MSSNSMMLTDPATATTATSLTTDVIVFAPYDGDLVGFYTPSTNVWSVLNISSLVNVDGKFRGAVSSVNGLVYLAPYSADGVMRVDVSTPTADLVDISSSLSYDRKFAGAACADAAAKLIFAPAVADV
eukprot:1146274-Prymnesium_polylepis.1